MGELAIGILIVAFLNTIWKTKDSFDQPKYWSKEEAAKVWQKYDSTAIEEVYKKDSIYHENKSRRKQNRNRRSVRNGQDNIGE